MNGSAVLMRGPHYSGEGETAILCLHTLLLTYQRLNQSLRSQVQIARRLELKRHRNNLV